MLIPPFQCQGSSKTVLSEGHLQHHLRQGLLGYRSSLKSFVELSESLPTYIERVDSSPQGAHIRYWVNLGIWAPRFQLTANLWTWASYVSLWVSSCSVDFGCSGAFGLEKLGAMGWFVGRASTYLCPVPCTWKGGWRLFSSELKNHCLNCKLLLYIYF